MALALAMPGEMYCGVLRGADRVAPPMSPTKSIALAAMARDRLVFMKLTFLHLPRALHSSSRARVRMQDEGSLSLPQLITTKIRTCI